MNPDVIKQFVELGKAYQGEALKHSPGIRLDPETLAQSAQWSSSLQALPAHIAGLESRVAELTTELATLRAAAEKGPQQPET